MPVSEPAGFNWPGPWLALLRADDGGGLLAAVAFGSPPGLIWNPGGGPERFEAVEAGFVIAPADPALWERRDEGTVSGEGVVEAIVVGPAAEGALRRVENAGAISGRGLEGDRYFDGRGTFSGGPGGGRDLTLVEAEVLEKLAEGGDALTPEEARRNVATRGLALNALVGRRFRIGSAECVGARLCEPCAHLERLCAAAGRPGVLRALVHRGGLRADIVKDGEIRVGDAITPL